MANRGPIVRIHSTGGSGGINCCCCTCCSCVNLKFLKSEPGIYKLSEMILGAFCQSLALNFGMGYSDSLGSSYHGFLTTASWCLMTTSLLLFCYLVSTRSFGLVRQSLFETAFNTIACFCYISSASYLGFTVNTVLYPLYKITAFFQVYPAMTSAYVFGTVTGIIYGVDAYKSYRFFKGYR